LPRSGYTHDHLEKLMRILALVGVVLMGLGAFIVFRGMSVTSDRNVLKVGPLEATVEEKKAVPAWAGGAAIVGGPVLVVAGMRQKR